ncbi:hypothetical protein [Helicobacter labetoulli]|uniref:hypothetical protein n=1 Tax=Helicobacter labetoulli TaxID=2315333 RepID=UPI000EF735D5|nr:hypothetical protein [Helicobacter labetoulli]
MSFMSKKVRVEKTIYKIPLFTLIVALFGMFAFLFVNSDNLSNFKIAVIDIGIELDFIVMAGMVWHYIINIDKLEDL